MCLKAGEAAALCLEEMHLKPAVSLGFCEIWLKVLGVEGDSSWSLGGSSASIQAAQKLCCQRFYYYGLLCLLLFLCISRLYCIKKFPYSSFMQQKLHQSCISQRNWVFSDSARQCLGGDNKNSSESWGREGTGHLHLSSPTVPRQ